MKYLKEISTEYIVFGLREDGIIESYPTKGYDGEITKAEAMEMVAAMKELCSDFKKPLLMKMGDNNLNGEARKYFIGNVHPSMIAFVGTTFLARMMASLLFKFKKLPVPVKLFRKEEVAMAWIREQQRLALPKEMVGAQRLRA